MLKDYEKKFAKEFTPENFNLEYTVADIQFAFNHSHLIDLMTERGQAISEGDHDEIEESNQAINKYI